MLSSQNEEKLAICGCGGYTLEDVPDAIVFHHDSCALHEAKSVLLGLPQYGNATTVVVGEFGELPSADMMVALDHMLKHNYIQTKKQVPDIGPMEIAEGGWVQHWELTEIGVDDKGEPIWETDEDGEYTLVWRGKWDYRRGWTAFTKSREL